MMIAEVLEASREEYRNGDDERRDEAESQSSDTSATEFRGITLEEMAPWERQWADTIGTPTFGVEETQWQKLQSVRDSLVAEIEQRKKQRAVQAEPAHSQEETKIPMQKPFLGNAIAVVESMSRSVANEYRSMLYGYQRPQRRAIESEPKQSVAPVASQPYAASSNKQQYFGAQTVPARPASPAHSILSSHYAATERKEETYYYSATARSKMQNYYKALDTDPATESSTPEYQGPTLKYKTAPGMLAVSAPPRPMTPPMELEDFSTPKKNVNQLRFEAPSSPEVIHLETYDKNHPLDLVNQTIYSGEESLPIQVASKDETFDHSHPVDLVDHSVYEEGLIKVPSIDVGEEHTEEDNPAEKRLDPPESTPIQQRQKNVKIGALESKRIVVRRMAADRLEAEYANLVKMKKNQLTRPKKKQLIPPKVPAKSKASQDEENQKRLAAIRMKNIRMLSVVNRSVDESSEDEDHGTATGKEHPSQESKAKSPAKKKVVHMQDVDRKVIDQIKKVDARTNRGVTTLRGRFRQAKPKKRGSSSSQLDNSLLEKTQKGRVTQDGAPKAGFSILSGSGAACCLPQGLEQMNMNFYSS